MKIKWPRYMQEEMNMGGKAKRKIKVGDEFDVPVRVVEFRAGLPKPFKVNVRGTNGLSDWVCGATLEASVLVKAAPESLKVGDRVKHNSLLGVFTIVAIDDGSAWLKSDGVTGHWTYRLSEVRGV